MVTINQMSREFNEIEQYLMTISPNITSIKDVADGTKIMVDGFLVFDDIKEATGETVEVLSVITPDKKVYSCQSKTFKRSLYDIFSIMKDKQFGIIKGSGTTKAGRPYVNCFLDIESL